MIGVSRFLKVQERHDQACQADLDVAAEVPRVWRLIESVPFCMLSTLSGSGPHSRPMGAYVRRGEACIYFFSKVDARKCDDIRENRKAWATFVNPSRHTYVVVSGRAEITYDRKKMQELWSISERLWWKRADNPAACLIKFIPEEAEYWDSPNVLVRNIKVGLALLKGGYPHIGQHKKVLLISQQNGRLA